MQILLNGEVQEVLDGVSLGDLLRLRQLSRAPLAIEVNHQIIPRGDHDDTTIQPGDSIEIVTLVGGG